MTPERPLTTRQLADRWQVSERHLRNMIADGRLEAIKWGGTSYRIAAQTVRNFEDGHLPVRPVGRIYIVRCEITGLVKIGFASNLEKRFISLQTMSPTKLTLVGSRVGTRAAEQRLHEKFKDKRRHGEWFAMSDADIQSFMTEAPQ